MVITSQSGLMCFPCCTTGLCLIKGFFRGGVGHTPLCFVNEIDGDLHEHKLSKMTVRASVEQLGEWSL